MMGLKGLNYNDSLILVLLYLLLL